MKTKINGMLLWMAYLYLVFPVVIFLLGWCKWYIGIPAAIISAVSVYKCVKDRECVSVQLPVLSTEDKWRVFVAAVIIFCWVGLSGIGGYSFQNTDHPFRNAIFEILVNNEWPVVRGDRALIYYIGFWLPAALVGKSAGMEWGYATQFVWAILGVWIVYALICTWRGKIRLWPLVILIFFGGMDLLGAYFGQNVLPVVFGTEHLERWAGVFQYSSNTTQLYWVFNQALPTWVAIMLIFLDEHPRNMLFVSSLIILTSVLPFAGMLPIVCYYMYTRCKWERCGSRKDNLKLVLHNWGSFQNLIGAACVGVIIFAYLMGNVQFEKIVSVIRTVAGVGIPRFALGYIFLLLVLWCLCVLGLGYAIVMLSNRKRSEFPVENTLAKVSIVILAIVLVLLLQLQMRELSMADRVFYMVRYAIFLLVEVGVLLCSLYKYVEAKNLFHVVTVWLCVIPAIKVGESIDFCMRASIPALFILMLWCMEIVSHKKKEIQAYAIIGCLVIGAVTAFHEIKRSFVESRAGYIINVVEESAIFNGNNFSGETKTFFGEYISK